MPSTYFGYTAAVFWKASLLPGLTTALVTLLLTPLVIRLAYYLRAVDVPGGRKQHDRSTPRLGGVAILGGVVVVLGPALAVFTPPALQSMRAGEIVGFCVAVGLVFCLGLVDDIYGLRASYKLGVQIVAATVVVSMGWQFHTLRLPLEGSFQPGALAPVLSVLWIVGVTNAINFVDGLDGLASGVVAIIGGSLLVLALLQGSLQTVVVTSCIVGGCLGFLRHNWRPAKVYMGDSGALTLGFLLATVSLRATPSVKASAALAILVPVLALGLPVIDTLLVMWYRFLRGHRHMNRIARMFHADRAHLHHLLLDSRTERRTVLTILFGMVALFCTMALLVAASDNWHLGLFFLLVEIGAVVMVRRSGLSRAMRNLAVEQVGQVAENGALPYDPPDAAGTLGKGRAPYGSSSVAK